jgi:broad specificity phosphatase PhoE
MGTIYLIRHSQASFGAADYDQLSELGFEQAGILGRALHLRRPRADKIVCGSLKRHRQTAEGCLTAMGLPAQWDTDPAWDEYDLDAVMRVHHPRYVDRTVLAAELAASDNPRRKFQEVFVAAMDRWAGGRHDAEYEESWPAFTARVNEALRRLNVSLAKSQGALVFTSGGPIAAVCGALLNLSGLDALRINSKLANASVTKLVCSDKGVHLSTMNEHAHFEGEKAPFMTYR